MKRTFKIARLSSLALLMIVSACNNNSNNIFLSSRNLPEVKVITADELNTYIIMNAYSMVLVDGVQDTLAARANA